MDNDNSAFVSVQNILDTAVCLDVPDVDPVLAAKMLNFANSVKDNENVGPRRQSRGMHPIFLCHGFSILQSPLQDKRLHINAADFIKVFKDVILEDEALAEFKKIMRGVSATMNEAVGGRSMMIMMLYPVVGSYLPDGNVRGTCRLVSR